MRFKAFLLGSGIAFSLWIVVPALLMSWNEKLELPVYVNTTSRIVGAVICSMGLTATLYIVSKHIKTGRVTPVAVEKPVKFIAEGIYKYSRNPMYITIWFTFLGGFLFFGHFLLLIYVLLAIPALHLFVVYKEEPELKKIFGKQYFDYLKEVPRWL